MIEVSKVVNFLRNGLTGVMICGGREFEQEKPNTTHAHTTHELKVSHTHIHRHCSEHTTTTTTTTTHQTNTLGAFYMHLRMGNGW